MLSKYSVETTCLVGFTVDSLVVTKHVGSDTASGKRGARLVRKRNRSSTVRISFLARNRSPRNKNKGTNKFWTPKSDAKPICDGERPSWIA